MVFVAFPSQALGIDESAVPSAESAAGLPAQ
jgi:hypothetical protein